MAELDIDDIQRRMDASLASLHTECMGLRAGRASTGMLEPIMVDAYGSKMQMNQVGNISAPEPRLLTVSVWDAGAEKELKKIPFFVRGKAKRNTERFAMERGISVITTETLYESKAYFSQQ